MEIVPGIQRVDGVNGNCYIIGTDELAVVDTGMPNNAGNILGYIRKMGKKPQDVKQIIITHGHIDHIGSLAALRKATGAKVAAHSAEAEFIAGTKQMPMAKGSMSAVLKALGTVMRIEHAPVDVLLEEGQEAAGFRVVHTPGHTPGSIALLDAKRGIILVGDTLRVGKNGVEGPPMQFNTDSALAEASMKKIASLDFDIMLSGHGEPLRPKAAEKVREFLKAG
jgi:glyoxylase-like metal-dependent hydrolase (beta-lactamase superfamily II)